MNFFERQAASRRQSQLLVVLFAMAVIAVIVAVDLVLIVLFSAHALESGSLIEWAIEHPQALLNCSAVVLAIIVLASLYKTARLEGGGGAVARSLGGVRVSADTQDLAQRRLLNVVEEMSIASGVPMPEVYLLEQELAINAFAAGHTPADAAVAVTRGALDALDRDELQGVIAHEFSHILNGDMRLNIRLMGLVFGLLVIAQIGRTVLRHASEGRRSKGINALAAAALAIWGIGYVGQFFGRVIQAAVSRSRESLADASAVQFTRDPSGLRDALVKIGAASAGSKLSHPETEEVAHMLFAAGTKRMFATHPPLIERLRAIDPSFQPSEFERVRAAMAREQASAAKPAPTASADRLQDVINVPLTVTPGAVVELVGHPGTAQVQLAHAIRESLPSELLVASERPSSARAVLLALGVGREAQTRDMQLRFIDAQAGRDVGAAVRSVLLSIDALEPLQRLPLLTRCAPALRQLARPERQALLTTLNGLLVREGQQTLSVYALRKVAQVHLRDEMNPPRVGRLTVRAARAELNTLLNVIAREGHADERTARQAFEMGMRTLGLQAGAVFSRDGHWPAQLDRALTRLDALQPTAKEMLVEALVKTIAYDQRLSVVEAELLRTVCATLHCPLPPLVQ